MLTFTQFSTYMIHYVESEIVWGLHFKIELQKTMYMKTSVVNIYNRRKKMNAGKQNVPLAKGHSAFTLMDGLET